MIAKQKTVKGMQMPAAHVTVRIAEPELLSLRACEDLTSISHHTWRSYAYKGIVSSVKIGDRLLIPRTEVQRVITQGYRPSVEEQRAAGRPNVMAS